MRKLKLVEPGPRPVSVDLGFERGLSHLRVWGEVPSSETKMTLVEVPVYELYDLGHVFCVSLQRGQ